MISICLITSVFSSTRQKKWSSQALSMWVSIYLKEQYTKKKTHRDPKFSLFFFFSFAPTFSSTKQEGSRNIRIVEYPKRATRWKNAPTRAWPAPHSVHSWRYPRSEPHDNLLSGNLRFLRLPMCSHCPRSGYRLDPPPLTIQRPTKKNDVVLEGQ